MTATFSPVFYLTLALLLALLVFMWRWYLRRSERSTVETVMVVLVTLGSLSPLFFLAYLMLVRR
ncbi:hypothetical protein [Hymenobacter properus]|uniref:Uncharacterized protein n=1 Tax=Hymenobacter properus TaxID=2791026 RepID=A0A931FLG2_9BACT|nr:hypothetical protein [Hymenobacter properus]MBF9140669.1 hypothetical protein [Hymenobacter properus]MBR7719477.1 hypothetical protein [Microvirga sp. SRT04]